MVQQTPDRHDVVVMNAGLIGNGGNGGNPGTGTTKGNVGIGGSAVIGLPGINGM
jgi:hypothetical protein